MKYGISISDWRKLSVAAVGTQALGQWNDVSVDVRRGDIFGVVKVITFI